MADTLGRAYREMYDARVASVAQGLRDMADRIERAGKPIDRPSASGIPPCTYAAQQVHHELAWGIANLSADQLIGVAQQADHHRRDE